MATLQPLLSSRFSSCFSFSPTPLDVHLFRIVATQRCFLLSLAVLFSCSSYCARAKFSQARSIPSTRQCVILPHVFALFPYFIRRYSFLTNAVFLHRKERERERETGRAREEEKREYLGIRRWNVRQLVRRSRSTLIRLFISCLPFMFHCAAFETSLSSTTTKLAFRFCFFFSNFFPFCPSV